MFTNRPDYNSPEYKAWRFSVFKRDRWECQLCLAKGIELNAHHIIKWSIAPHLRYVTSNGITLCKKCHNNIVTGREEQFVARFKEIVAQKKIQAANIREIKTGKKKKNKKKPYKPRNPRLRF